MLKSDLYYELPQHLIAQRPLSNRTSSRLLCLDGTSGTLQDKNFLNLPELLMPGDLLVLNDTAVIQARLYGQKSTGGKVEILIERIQSPVMAVAHVRSSKSPKPGTLIELDKGHQCRVTGRVDDLFELEFDPETTVDEVLRDVGHIPLPPYIARPDNVEDKSRYQTVFARTEGAIAAPTAGLHFDSAMLDDLAAKGIEHTFVTLHVGSGTFLPLRVENLDHHQMHAEFCEVNSTAVAAVMAARQRGNRVVAVGTTAVRSLESAALSGQLEPYRGDTRLFIRPGFQFGCVDAILTNFHLPESTLLALVCAFAGQEAVMNAYHHAVRQEYRFFSYGDAMFITRKP